MKIFIICSKKFYSKCEYYKKELEKMGHEVILPNSYDDPEFEIRVRDASRKEHQILVKKLFLESENKVNSCDCVLVLNFDSKSTKNYIGGSTFIEMYMAYEKNKKIYILNEPTQREFLDEISGFGAVILYGDLTLIKDVQKEKIKLCRAVHLVLKVDDKLLFLKRKNTGFMDGKYSFVAGHIEKNETVKEAMKREAYEEIGIIVKEKDLQIVHIMNAKMEKEYIYYFLYCDKYEGKIVNAELNKCDKLVFHEINNLPKNIIDYIKVAIDNYKKGQYFSTYELSNL